MREYLTEDFDRLERALRRKFPSCNAAVIDAQEREKRCRDKLLYPHVKLTFHIEEKSNTCTGVDGEDVPCRCLTELNDGRVFLSRHFIGECPWRSYETGRYTVRPRLQKKEVDVVTKTNGGI